MSTKTNVINKAASYIGTHEDPMGSNNVIFNTDYYGYPVSGEWYPWCCAFVWDIFRMCGASDLFYNGQRTAYCPTVLSWAKSNGMVVPFSQAQYGDLVLFDWNGDGVADHIGFVEDLRSDGTLICIEGNTSDASHNNGGWVLRRNRYANSVIAIVRIRYPKDEGYMFNVKTIKKGDTGKDVYLLQSLLKGKGWKDQNGKVLKLDKSFGKSTEAALKKYQTKYCPPATGVCDDKTWKKILGV